MVKRVNKIVMTGLMLLAGSSIALADAIPYLGVSVGANIGGITVRDTQATRTGFNSNGAAGGVYAGFGTTVDQAQKYYLGIEGFADESAAETATKQVSTVNGVANAYFRTRFSYGGSVMTGFKLTDATLVYLRIGALRTQFVLNQSVVPSGYTSNNKRNVVSGGQGGIGLQTYFARSWSVRGEYDYNSYRSFRSFGNKVTVKVNQFKVGLAYGFC